jgi:hypothetical protein
VALVLDRIAQGIRAPLEELMSDFRSQLSAFQFFVPFIEAGVLDVDQFEKIIEQHQLVEKWRQFQRQFLEG